MRLIYDANIASVDGTGSDADVTAINTGTANVIGHWSVYSYIVVFDFENGGKRCESETNTIEPEAPVKVAPVKYTRVAQDYGVADFNSLISLDYTATLSLPSNSPPCQGNAFQMKARMAKNSNATLYPNLDPRNVVETDDDGQFRINGWGIEDADTTAPFFNVRLQRLSPGNANKPIRFKVSGFTSAGIFSVGANVTITCD